MAKVINKGDKPYYFTYDGMNYGPINPGEVMEIERKLAEHAIKRSWALDDEGVPDHQTIFPVESLTPEELRATMRFSCPYVGISCSAPAFKTLEALREHLDEHMTDPLDGVVLDAPPAVKSAPRGR